MHVDESASSNVIPTDTTSNPNIMHNLNIMALALPSKVALLNIFLHSNAKAIRVAHSTYLKSETQCPQNKHAHEFTDMRMRVAGLNFL